MGPLRHVLWCLSISTVSAVVAAAGGCGSSGSGASAFHTEGGVEGGGSLGDGGLTLGSDDASGGGSSGGNGSSAAVGWRRASLPPASSGPRAAFATLQGDAPPIWHARRREPRRGRKPLLHRPQLCALRRQHRGHLRERPNRSVVHARHHDTGYDGRKRQLWLPDHELRREHDPLRHQRRVGGGANPAIDVQVFYNDASTR